MTESSVYSAVKYVLIGCSHHILVFLVSYNPDKRTQSSTRQVLCNIRSSSLIGIKPTESLHEDWNSSETPLDPTVRAVNQVPAPAIDVLDGIEFIPTEKCQPGETR